MTALQKLWHFLRTGGESAIGSLAGFGTSHGYGRTARSAAADQAALRLFTLPRGFRQRSRGFLLNV